MLFFFFFQAEDGIRDKLVTGVQTCALPISAIPSRSRRIPRRSSNGRARGLQRSPLRRGKSAPAQSVFLSQRRRSQRSSLRSEERRVGKECRSRGSTDH